MKRKTCIRAAGALVALALALPAGAAAVPSVTTVDGKLDAGGATFLTDRSGAGLTGETRYVVSADGYVAGYAETNGVTSGGVLDYSVLPEAYRAPMTAEDERTYAAAQTGVQPHATCSGVAALSDGTTILAWQGREPVYDYVPWQRTSAGLGDDPSTWIPVVARATGVDLSAATDLRRACTDLGGTYVAADTASTVADALVADALAPLERQVASLRRQVTTLTRSVRTARDAQKAAETAYQALFTKPIALTLAAKRFAPANGLTVMITGSPTDPVDVTLELTKKQARKLGLDDPVIAEAQGVLDDDGAVLLTLKPDADVVKALTTVKARGKAKKAKAARGVLPVRVLAVSGGNQDEATAVLVR